MCHHVVVMCRRGTSVVRSLKLLTLPHFEQESRINNYCINQHRLFDYDSGLFE